MIALQSITLFLKIGVISNELLAKIRGMVMCDLTNDIFKPFHDITVHKYITPWSIGF